MGRKKKINGYASLYTIHYVVLLKTEKNQDVILNYDLVYEYFNQKAEEKITVKNFSLENSAENEDEYSI